MSLRRHRPSEAFLAELLGEVLCIASRDDGQTRHFVADALGVQKGTLDKYAAPAEGLRIPGPSLAELLMSPDILGERAHRALCDRLLRPAGLETHQILEPGTATGGDVMIESLELNAAAGRLSEAVIGAMGDGRITDTERANIKRALRGVLVELHDVNAASDASAGAP